MQRAFVLLVAAKLAKNFELRWIGDLQLAQSISRPSTHADLDWAVVIIADGIDVFPARL